MSDNDLSRLQVALSVQLSDESFETWTNGETEDLITWAVAQLYPRYAREINPQDSAATITIVAESYFYVLDETIRNVVRVDLVGPADSAGERLDYGRIDGGLWEVAGDLESGDGLLHVGAALNDAYDAGYYRLTGYGAYGVSGEYTIPDRLVPLTLAMARAEAVRRIAADRSRFKAWLEKNQGQNVSVNELKQLADDADAEIRYQKLATQRTWQKPTPGRQG